MPKKPKLKKYLVVFEDPEPYIEVVVKARNENEAIKKAEKKEPDGIFIDIQEIEEVKNGKE